MRSLSDIEQLNGKTFGRLVLINSQITGRYRYGYFKCECGNMVTKILSHVLKGAIKSCGCLMREGEKSKNFVRKHGMTKTKEFRAWQAMITRCTNPNYKYFHRYGGRGIVVCERWLHSFSNFLLDMGNPPTKEHTLDRIDNNGNYEPSNCRWATWCQQRRNTSSNRWIEYDGKTLVLQEWANILGLTSAKLHYQLKTKSLNELFANI